MKRFFRSKKKLLLVCMFVLISLTACSNPRGADGKTKIDSLISVEDTTVVKEKINIPDELVKEYEKYGAKDEIPVKATSFGEAMDEGWFTGLIVFPIAQLINWVATFSDAGFGIIAATFFIQLLIFAFSIKSQVSSQKMQALQPEMNKIQAKYAGKSDERSKMAQAQEMQGLYKQYNINPFGTILVTFIQFPVIIGMYQATMRAFSVATGSFSGINLTMTPIEGITASQWSYLVIFLLMVAFQLLSFKLPQWLQERRKKKSGIKEKKYAEPKKKASGMMGSMNMMMYMSTGMIAIFAINWPIGMSFYWLVNSIARVIQNIVIHKFFIKE